METRANHALIGLFTLLVLAAAFGFIWWFAGAADSNKRVSYRIQFEGTVSGLSTGSAVLFNGIRVGEVSTLELDASDPRRVFATVSVDQAASVRTDTKARLEYQGLTGVAAIELQGGSPDAALLKGSRKNPPLIVAERSAVQDLLEAARNILARADGIMGTVETVVANNKDSINRSVQNVERFTNTLATVQDSQIIDLIEDASKFFGTLARNSDSVDTIAREGSQLVQRLNASSTKLDSILTKTDGLLGSANDAGLISDVRDAAKSIKLLANNLDKRTAEISTGFARFSNQSLRDLDVLISNGRQTITEVNRVVRNFERNPSGFLFGRSGIPDYKR